MRKATWQALGRWLTGFKQDHAGQPRKLGIGGWICFGARVVGTALFFGSFGFLAAPFLAGWSWTEALIGMALGMAMSRPFLTFHMMWAEAESVFIYIFDKLVRNRPWTYYTSKKVGEQTSQA